MESFTLVLQLLIDSPATLAGVVFLFSLLVGSFLNVVIYRLPIMMERAWREECEAAMADDNFDVAAEKASEPKFNLVTPASRCPACQAPIRAWQNIPVISFLLQRGRCGSCKTKVSWQYPLVELTTALLSAYVIWHFGLSAQGIFAVLMTWALISLTMIDWQTQLLPDSITLPLLWLGLLLSLWDIFVPAETAIIGAAAGYLSLWTVYQAFKLFTGKEGMGFGDFKLLAALGAWLGWQQLPVIILLSSVVGTVIGIAIIITRGQDRSVPIAFGPFIAIAGWIAMLWGDSILENYLHISGF